MKIILIGFMGSGKSSVANRLNQILQFPVLEMDEIVFQKTSTKSMHEVFSKGGETLLRETEIKILREYAQIDNTIISTGGGVVLNKMIIDDLKHPNSKIFFLNASFETIKSRLVDDSSRPLFENKIEAESLYLFRLPLYLKYADHIVEVDNKSVEEIAQEIFAYCLKG